MTTHLSHVDTFELTEDHLKLLRRSLVSQRPSGVQVGVFRELYRERPYGNSDVVGDLLETLGWDESRSDEAERLHQETPMALQIVLCTGSFTPGTYRKADRYIARSWQLVDSQPPVVPDEAVAAFLAGDDGLGEWERTRNGLRAALAVSRVLRD